MLWHPRNHGMSMIARSVATGKAQQHHHRRDPERPDGIQAPPDDTAARTAARTAEILAASALPPTHSSYTKAQTASGTETIAWQVLEHFGIGKNRVQAVNMSPLDAAEKLGWSWHPTDRNWDRSKHDPAMAGFMGWGDQSGAKQSTLKTYLQDAVENGAEVIVGCQARKVLVEDGRAAGVEADVGGAKITIRAPRVVVAGGALESPALLLSSGIGGPAAGKYLRLHPCTLIFASYSEDQKAWWGAPHAAVVNEFENGLEDDGYGFLIEGAQYTTGLGGSAIPFTTAAEHKEVLAGYANGSITINLTRERGGGQVFIDGDGNSMPTYSMTDPRDIANMHFGLEQQVRLHHAAGAKQIYALSQGMPGWRVGDDLEAFVSRIHRMPLRAGGARLFAAHQMGSCRMGSDPAESVANPNGELHDVAGVWIGDGSAFPTPSGTNPMITIMALASRTAERILDEAGATRKAGQTEEAAA